MEPYQGAIDILERVRRSYEISFEKILREFQNLKREVLEYSSFMRNQVYSSREKSEKILRKVPVYSDGINIEEILTEKEIKDLKLIISILRDADLKDLRERLSQAKLGNGYHKSWIENYIGGKVIENNHDNGKITKEDIDILKRVGKDTINLLEELSEYSYLNLDALRRVLEVLRDNKKKIIEYEKTPSNFSLKSNYRPFKERLNALCESLDNLISGVSRVLDHKLIKIPGYAVEIFTYFLIPYELSSIRERIETDGSISAQDKEALIKIIDFVFFNILPKNSPKELISDFIDKLSIFYPSKDQLIFLLDGLIEKEYEKFKESLKKNREKIYNELTSKNVLDIGKLENYLRESAERILNNIVDLNSKDRIKRIIKFTFLNDGLREALENGAIETALYVISRRLWVYRDLYTRANEDVLPLLDKGEEVYKSLNDILSKMQNLKEEIRKYAKSLDAGDGI